MEDLLRALSREWNEAGRRYAKDVQARLERFHRGGVDDPELPADPRDDSLAARVLESILGLNQLGRWQECRRWFDPAHDPFIPSMGDQGLPFVVALGEDEALFRRGSTYQEGHLWHVAGERLTPLPEVLAAAISPDRQMLALASLEGIRVLQGWGGSEVARFPWPSTDDMVPPWVPDAARDRYEVEPVPNGLEYLCVSNSGLRIAVALPSGVAVGDSTADSAVWRLALPLHDQPDEWVLEELEQGDDARFHGDMIHVAMSGDGRFVACGSQDQGHHLLAVEDDGRARLLATFDHASEYPHNACFSTDALHIAFNSCHFYSGATIAVAMPSIDKADTDNTQTPVINGYLRVYASTWLPQTALPEEKSAFALAGASVLTIVTPLGEVLHETLFGSSASGIDYCPHSDTLVLGSYSGILSFLKPSEVDPWGIGWRPPKELKRWCFFKDLPPIQW